MTVVKTGNRASRILIGVLLMAPLIAGIYLFAERQKLQTEVNKLYQQVGIVEGEVYRLRQEINGRDARIAFLTDPSFERIKAKSATDSSALWLLFRQADSAWYAEVSHVKALPEGHHLRLYGKNGGETHYVGHFEALSETIGLQKIGKSARVKTVILTSALRSSLPDFDKEQKAYGSDYAPNHAP